MPRLHIALTLLLALLLAPARGRAQQYDAGGELAAEGTLKLGRGWNAHLGEELRLTGGGTRFAKSQTSAGVGHNLLRHRLKPYGWRLRAEAEYAFIYRLNSDHLYEAQHRANLSVAASKTVGDWRFSLRERAKLTFRGAAFSGGYNPRLYLTTRLQAAHQRPDSRWGSFASAEAYVRTAHPKGTKLNELRFRVGASYRIDSHSTLGAQLKLCQEINTKAPSTLLLAGVDYGYTF